MDVSRDLSRALRVPPGWPAATLDRTRPTRQERAAHRLYLLTELLTRLVGTPETERDADDSRRVDALVSETHWDTGDAQDVRRMAHNPATTDGF
jgi:hypothetical protein